MSAIVCGKRSNFFDDLQSSSSSSSPPPVSKRIRCSSSSPVRFSPPTTTAAAAATGAAFSSFSANFFSAASSSSPVLDHLVTLFPNMDKQFLEQVLEGCGNDLDSAIKSLNELRLSSEDNLGCAASNHIEEINLKFSNKDSAINNDDGAPAQDPQTATNLSTESAEWVELFVKEMLSASNIDDAKARASRALEVLEKSIRERVTTEAAQSFQQENQMLKQQLQAVIHENNLLKRAVAIQHDRQKEFDDRNEELHQLKQVLAQYQEQLRTLEVNNYALTMHLKQAQQNNSIPGRFHPDIF